MSDYLDRLNEGTTIPFWRDVISALQRLWKSDTINNKDWVLHTLIWHNPEFRMQIIPDWNNIGIHTVHDSLTSNRSIMSQREFETNYKIKTR